MKLSKQQKNLREYLIGCIDFTWYNRDWAIFFDTINNLREFCQDEVGGDVMYWLKWLPSCLHFAFSYYDISIVLEKCWYKKTTDQDYQEKYYWENLAKIIKYCD